MLSVSITYDLSQFSALIGVLPGYLDARREPIHGAMDRASVELMRGQQRRFVSASGGDGTWLPHAELTKYKRLRKQKLLAGATQAITARLVAATFLPLLYVTGTLELGLFERGGSGHFVDFEADRVTEGVNGGSHPDTTISVGELAIIHHFGSPKKHIPARPVFGPVDFATLEAVSADLTRGVVDAVVAAAAAIGGLNSAA